MAAEYPEHEKLKGVQEQSQFTGELLEYFQSKGYEIAHYPPEVPGNTLVPVQLSINSILSDMFQIDLVKLEEEKQQMLEKLKQAHTEHEH